MSTQSAIILLLLLGLLAWWWAFNMRYREAAIQIATESCAQLGYHLLDATVSLSALRPFRGEHGWTLMRTYRFEYSVDSEQRQEGFIIIADRRLLHIGFAPDEHTRD